MIHKTKIYNQIITSSRFKEWKEMKEKLPFIINFFFIELPFIIITTNNEK